MTVSSTLRREDYTGDGATSEYDFDFVIFQASDLLVTEVDDEDEETTLVLNTDYTVDIDDDGTGSITLTEALTSGHGLTIRRVLPLTQATDIRNQGDFYPEAHEKQFDRLVMIAQQQQDELDRCIKAAETDNPEEALVLPPADERASKFLAFDSDGLPVASDGGIDDAIPVSSFAETLIDDANASAALTTLGFSAYGKTLIDDADASAALTTLGVSTYAKTILDDTTAAAARTTLEISTVSETFSWFHNLGLQSATTTNTRDSIKITSKDGTALSASNPAYVWLQGATVGTLTMFTVTSDVTIDLTGAHWGLGTNGDFNGVYLRVHAINNNGTLKWGVSLSHFHEVADTSTSTTATSVNAKALMLVNSAVSTGTWNCRQVGYFRANFDDTGGAAEDLWSLSTARSEIRVGQRVPTQTDWAALTPTGSWSANSTYTGFWKRDGEDVIMQLAVNCSGAPTSAALSFNYPTGFLPDTTKLAGADSNRILGTGMVKDSGSTTYAAWALYSASNMPIYVMDSSSTHGALTPVTQASTVPISFGASDGVHVVVRYPVLQWAGGNP